MATRTLPLSKTNPHLKDQAKRRAGIIRAVISSSAIEGIHGVVITDADIPANKRPTHRRKSSTSVK